METDPESENTRFRISPTAQDFNYIFHPEEGDSVTVTQSRIDDYTNRFRYGRHLKLIHDLEIKGEKLPEEDLTPEQQATIQNTINSELSDPTVQSQIEKMSFMSLNGDEVTASLILSIKELKLQNDILKTQLDNLTSRIEVLENP